jgi:hypothetical protein
MSREELRESALVERLRLPQKRGDGAERPSCAVILTPGRDPLVVARLARTAGPDRICGASYLDRLAEMIDQTAPPRFSAKFLSTQ